jgi:hypothetical protein
MRKWQRHFSKGVSIRASKVLLGQASQHIARDHCIHFIAAEKRLAVERVLDYVIGPTGSNPDREREGAVAVP